MYQFFVPPENIQGNRVVISGEDVNHIKNVLRMRVGEEISVSNGEDGKEYRAPCRVHLFGNKEYGLTCVEAKMYYQLGNAYVFVMYRAATEQMPYENGGGVGFDTEQFVREDYVTEKGLTCVLYKRYTGVHPLVNWSGYAVATVDGYLIHISLDAPSEQEVESTLKSILDAYG